MVVKVLKTKERYRGLLLIVKFFFKYKKFLKNKSINFDLGIRFTRYKINFTTNIIHLILILCF